MLRLLRPILNPVLLSLYDRKRRNATERAAILANFILTELSARGYILMHKAGTDTIGPRATLIGILARAKLAGFMQ